MKRIWKGMGRGLIEIGLLSQYLRGKTEKYIKNISLAHVRAEN
jgi:hypothetical protein